MVRTCIATVLCLTLAAVAGTAGAAWTLIDDFESYDVGTNIHGQNGWTATGELQTVQDDPGAFGNQALQVTQDRKHIYKAATIADGDTGTLFFRFHVPAGQSVDFGVGTTIENPPVDGTHISDYFRIVGTSLQVHHNNGWRGVGSYSTGSWYNVWNVIDNQNDKWHAYIEGPGFTGQQQLAYGSTTDFDFRHGGGTNDLVNFYIPTNANHAGHAYVDDIYLHSTAADLANPIPPSSVVLIDFNEAHSTPGGVWNTINAPGDATSANPFVLRSDNGIDSGIAIALTEAWEDSGATNDMTGAFATTHPDLAPGAADYFFLRDTNTSGTATLSGLDPDTPYRVELVVSMHTGSTRRQDTTVAGSFADSTPDGENFYSYSDGFVDGSLLRWNRVFPDANGNLDIGVLCRANTAHLNAIRLTAIPEPSALLLLGCGLAGLLAVGRRRR